MNRTDYKRVVFALKPPATLKKDIAIALQTKQPFGLKRGLILGAACCGMALLLAIGLPLFNGHLDGTQSPLQLFAITAYAAGGNTPSDPKAVELKPDVTIVIGCYSPSMNSTPGFPFVANCKDADRIVLRTDCGQFLLWSQDTGNTVVEKGKIYAAKPAEKVYWSVFEPDSQTPAQQAVVTFTAYRGEKRLGEQKVIIRQTQNFLYTAEFAR